MKNNLHYKFSIALLIGLVLYQSGYRIADTSNMPASERPKHIIVTAAR